MIGVTTGTLPVIATMIALTIQKRNAADIAVRVASGRRAGFGTSFMTGTLAIGGLSVVRTIIAIIAVTVAAITVMAMSSAMPMAPIPALAVMVAVLLAAAMLLGLPGRRTGGWILAAVGRLDLELDELFDVAQVSHLFVIAE